MNIFYLNENPKACAQLHVDKHVIKMTLEYAQILSTAHRVLDGVNLTKQMDNVLYKATHKNHPCTKWVCASEENYRWLYELFVETANEYTYRYGKVHLSQKKLEYLLSKPPKNIESRGFLMPAQAMPAQYKNSRDAVKAYKAYYKGEKSHMFKWTSRDINPKFFD